MHEQALACDRQIFINPFYESGVVNSVFFLSFFGRIQSILNSNRRAVIYATKILSEHSRTVGARL